MTPYIIVKMADWPYKPARGDREHVWTGLDRAGEQLKAAVGSLDDETRDMLSRSSSKYVVEYARG
jgi:hypothetical protein